MPILRTKEHMAGVKQYDRIDLLDRAIELFRREGYTATSTSDLVAELGVNRKSMYAEFGSKQELFEAALERYSAHHLTAILAPIEASDAGVDAIRALLAGFVDASKGLGRGRGCLLCNTAVERAALDPGARRYVDAYLERITRAFTHALKNAQCSGELNSDVDIDQLASFLTVAFVGLSAALRAEATSELVGAACRVVTDMLDNAGGYPQS